VFGLGEIEDHTIKYTSSIIKNQLGNEIISHSIVKSNVEFEEGQIDFIAKVKAIDGRCQLLLNFDASPWILVGINVLSGLYGIAKYNTLTSKYEALSITGEPSTLIINREYKVTVRVFGSIIDLLIDDILVASANEQVKRSQIALFFESSDEITVKDVVVQLRRPKAFVVIQFTDEYNVLYNEVIKPVVEEYGYDCERADETYTTNPILQDIIQSIQESSIVIADITPNNPNVFYEVGYSHAIGKPTILLCDKKREKLPFDVSSFRTLFYENSIGGKSAVEKNLKRYLDNVLNTNSKKNGKSLLN